MGLVRRIVPPAVMLGVLTTACGQEGGPAATSVSPSGDLRTSSTPVGASSELQWCTDVPPLGGQVVGNLAGSQNLDVVFEGVIRTYVNEHRDTFAGMWIDRGAGGTLVVAFTDDPEVHRDELAGRRPTPTDAVAVDPRPPIVDDRPIGEWDQTFDVVRATFTESELAAAQEQVNTLFDDSSAGLEATGISSDQNRVTVTLLEPTPERVAELAARVPTDRVCVDGQPLAEDREVFEPGDPLEVIVTPGSDGAVPADTVVSCGGGHQFPLSALDTARPVTDSADGQLISELTAFLRGPEGRYWPQRGWHILTETDEQLTLISADPRGAAFVSFEATRVGWSMAGASGYAKCRPRVVLPDGLGEVRWRIDPRFDPPTPDTTEIRVSVTEQACVGGQAMGERLLGPQIIETDTDVLIAFAAIALPGAHTCPGSPSTAVTVTLPTRLGERRIRDGLVVPIDISERLD